MICPYCGKENVDRSPFCASCGKSLAGTYDGAAQSSAAPETKPEANAETSAGAPEEVVVVSSVSVDEGVKIPSQAEAEATAAQLQPAAAQPQPTASQSQPQPAAAGAAQPQPQPAATTAAQPQPQPAAASAAQPQPAPATPQPQPAYYQPAQPAAAAPLYAKGCMGAAWSDITSSPGWFKKVLLLGLIMCVPILNFYVLGYVMRWARQLVLGKIEPMPQKIFEEGNFSQGFYGIVWLFVLGLVVGLVGGIIGLVPLLGALVVIALGIFQVMFGALGVLRIAISKRIGEAFSLQEDWRGFTKRFGSLFCATYVPELIIGAILTVVVSIVAVIAVLLLFSTGAVTVSYSYGYVSPETMLQVIMALLGMAPLLLITYYIGGVLYAFIYVWVYRAVGHYVARELPEWAALAPRFEPQPPYGQQQYGQ